MNLVDQEAVLVKERYGRRVNTGLYDNLGKYFFYNFYLKTEKELRISTVLRNIFGKVEDLKILEIGAGSGSNLLLFKKLGSAWENLFANELLEEKQLVLKENLPNSTIHIGDALSLNYSEEFDVVYQSTVFSSILNIQVKQQLADHMVKMLKPGGVIIWYDFKFNNPRNKDVKGVNKKEVLRLFSKAQKIDFYPVTIAPPIGRRIGKLYPIINFLFPFLRSHYIAVIKK
jgi:ubiquinone/menaquinone biosynthesis C-methylase UbiE